jgi:hypothetical protein
MNWVMELHIFFAGIEHMITMNLDDGVFTYGWTKALRQLYDHLHNQGTRHGMNGSLVFIGRNGGGFYRASGYGVTMCLLRWPLQD